MEVKGKLFHLWVCYKYFLFNMKAVGIIVRYWRFYLTQSFLASVSATDTFASKAAVKTVMPPLPLWSHRRTYLLLKRSQLRAWFWSQFSSPTIELKHEKGKLKFILSLPQQYMSRVTRNAALRFFDLRLYRPVCASIQMDGRIQL